MHRIFLFSFLLVVFSPVVLGSPENSLLIRVYILQLFLLWDKVKLLVTQPCPTLCNPMACNPPGSSTLGILQARIPECIAPFPSAGGLPTSGTEPGSPTSQADSLPFEPPGKPHLLYMGALLGVRQQVGEVFCGLMSTFQVLLLGLSSCAVTPRYVFSLFFLKIFTWVRQEGWRSE